MKILLRLLQSTAYSLQSFLWLFSTENRLTRRIDIPLWVALCALLWAVLVTQLYHQGVLP